MQRERFMRAPDGGAGGAPAAAAAPAAGAGAGAPAAAPAAAGAAPSAAGDWTTSLAPEMRQLVTTKGWKSPVDALAGYANLERLVGTDKLALPAKGADGARDWSAWDGWSALGRPESPDKYDLAEVKLPEGKQLQGDLAKGFLTIAHKEGLTQRQVAAVLGHYVGLEHQRDQGSAARAQQEAQTLDAAIATNWGAERDAKLALARNAAKQLGFKDEMLDKLEKAVGSFEMLNALADVGGKYFAEDGARGRADGGGGLGLPNSPAAAKAEIDRIMGEARAQGDKHPYLDKSHPEHAALQARVLRLYQVMSPEAPQ
jgi:hypothetical protein